MKKFLAVIALIPALVFGQTSSVQKSTSNNQITDNLTFGSGKTLTFNSGSTLTVATGTTISGLLTATPALTALGALTPASGALPYFNSTSSATTASLSSFSAGIFADTTASAWLTSLGAADSAGTYITQTADANLPSSFALSTLSTGLLKVTTTTGALTTAVPGTDYGLGTVTSASVATANGFSGTVATATSTPAITLSIAGSLSFPAGVKQTFAPSTTTSGMNVGTVTSDPSSPANGDIWYNSTVPALNARINGATVALGAGGAGGIGGSTGSTDKAILIANGTAGATLQSSLLTIGATGIVGFPAGIKQTFAPTTTTSGLNIGSIAGTVSTPAVGDVWYNSSIGLYQGDPAAAGSTRNFAFTPTTTVSNDIVTYSGTVGGIIQDTSAISAISGTIQATGGNLTLGSSTGTSTNSVIVQPASAGELFTQGFVLQGPAANSTFRGNQNTTQASASQYPTYMQASAVDGISILSSATTPESIIDFQVSGGSLSSLSATPTGSKSSVRFETTSNGSLWREAANIDFVATEGGATGAGSQIDFYTDATGTTTRTKQFTITNAGQLQSFVATGTAPFIVASTTNVANLNAASLNGATFAAPGAIGGTTPGTGVFVGVSTNSNAAAGVIGEYVESIILTGSAVPLTNATGANVTSISLTAGDWEVSGAVYYNGTSASQTSQDSSINTTSATITFAPGTWVTSPNITTTTTNVYCHVFPTVRESLSTTTTIYLVARSNFSAGSVSAYGNIRARRIR